MEVNYDSDDSWTIEGWNEHIKSLKVVNNPRKKKSVTETKKDSSKKRQEKKMRKTDKKREHASKTHKNKRSTK